MKCDVLFCSLQRKTVRVYTVKGSSGDSNVAPEIEKLNLWHQDKCWHDHRSQCMRWYCNQTVSQYYDTLCCNDCQFFLEVCFIRSFYKQACWGILRTNFRDYKKSTLIPKVRITWKMAQQESIPVGCVPPLVHCTIGGISWQRPPSDTAPLPSWQRPPDRDPPGRNIGPETENDMIHPFPWIEWTTGLKSLPCPKLRLRAVNIANTQRR